MTETQHTIGTWSDATFGASCPETVIAARAIHALAALVTALGDGVDADIASKAASASIALLWLAERKGFNLADAVQRKMVINRRTLHYREEHFRDFLSALNKEP